MLGGTVIQREVSRENDEGGCRGSEIRNSRAPSGRNTWAIWGVDRAKEREGHCKEERYHEIMKLQAFFAKFNIYLSI